MTDYQNGKIYRLTGGDKVYYGSTVTPLYKRFKGHKRDFKTNRKPSTSKILFEEGEVRIELVENYPCNSVIELREREAYYIKNFDCVNRCVPNRTSKDWRKDNIDYRQLNKLNCKCGGRYTEQNKTNHFNTEKHKNYFQKL